MKVEDKLVYSFFFFWFCQVNKNKIVYSLTCDFLLVDGFDVAVDGNEYSSGFVMAITEFRISGVSGVVVAMPTVKFDVFVTAGAGGASGAEVVVAISTFSNGIPFILSLKLLYIYIIKIVTFASNYWINSVQRFNVNRTKLK